MLARGAAEINGAVRHGVGRGGAEADFHAGQWGLAVELVDRSRYAAETRVWDLGDGTTSDEPYLIHRYAHAGTYTVTLTVTNDYGTSTATRTLDVASERRVAGRFGP